MAFAIVKCAEDGAAGSGCLPFYRFANICPYELIVLVAIAAYWIKAHRS